MMTTPTMRRASRLFALLLAVSLQSDFVLAASPLRTTPRTPEMSAAFSAEALSVSMLAARRPRPMLAFWRLMNRMLTPKQLTAVARANGLVAPFALRFQGMKDKRKSPLTNRWSEFLKGGKLGYVQKAVVQVEAVPVHQWTSAEQRSTYLQTAPKPEQGWAAPNVAAFWNRRENWLRTAVSADGRRLAVSVRPGIPLQVISKEEPKIQRDATFAENAAGWIVEYARNPRTGALSDPRVVAESKVSYKEEKSEFAFRDTVKYIYVLSRFDLVGPSVAYEGDTLVYGRIRGEEDWDDLPYVTSRHVRMAHHEIVVASADVSLERVMGDKTQRHLLSAFPRRNYSGVNAFPEFREDGRTFVAVAPDGVRSGTLDKKGISQTATLPMNQWLRQVEGLSGHGDRLWAGVISGWLSIQFKKEQGTERLHITFPKTEPGVELVVAPLDGKANARIENVITLLASNDVSTRVDPVAPGATYVWSHTKRIFQQQGRIGDIQTISSWGRVAQVARELAASLKEGDVERYITFDLQVVPDTLVTRWASEATYNGRPKMQMVKDQMMWVGLDTERPALLITSSLFEEMGRPYDWGNHFFVAAHELAHLFLRAGTGERDAMAFAFALTMAGSRGEETPKALLSALQKMRIPSVTRAAREVEKAWERIQSEYRHKVKGQYDFLRGSFGAGPEAFAVFQTVITDPADDETVLAAVVNRLGRSLRFLRGSLLPFQNVAVARLSGPMTKPTTKRRRFLQAA
jgi:hypothetical protein